MDDCIIFDIDGTLSDNSKRLHFIKRKDRKKDWKSYHSMIYTDKPIIPMVLIYRIIHRAIPIVIFTGRFESSRYITNKWFTEYNIPFPFKMLMRSDGDYTTNEELKRRMLMNLKRSWNPILAIDDNDNVIDMFLSEKVLCLKCLSQF